MFELFFFDNLYVFFVEDKGENEIVGRLLLGKSFEGKVFVKGIFVKTYGPLLKVGVDFFAVTLPRDRNSIERYTLNKTLSWVSL